MESANSPAINSNGLEHKYLLEGQDAPAPVVVLLHGELASSDFWTLTANDLASRYRLLRPQTFGGDLEAQALGILGLLDALGTAQYHLVGHSGGAVLALRVAAQRPQACQTLTLVDGLARTDGAFEQKIQGILAALEAGGPKLAAQVAMPWLWGASSLENSDRIEGMVLRAAQANPGEVRKALQAVLEYGDQRKHLRALECPTLVVVGSDDLLTPLRYSHEMVEWVKPGLGVLITLTGGGHNAPLEQPEEFSRILLGFLERHKEFVAGPADWQDTDEDGAELHDYSDLESLR